MGYVFAWDRGKADANARKHSVGFDEATTVFGDVHALSMPDLDHSADESR